MAISINPKPTIYRNLYENTGPGVEIIALVSVEMYPFSLFVISYYYIYDKNDQQQHCAIYVSALWCCMSRECECGQTRLGLQ